MPLFTICYMVTGGVQVEAETEDEAMERFESGEFDEEVGESLVLSALDVTEIIKEEEQHETLV